MCVGETIVKSKAITMKKLNAVLFAILCVGLLNAQDISVSIELSYSDDGTIEGYPEGFSTWKIFAVLPAEDDFLSSVYATFDSEPMTITTSTNQIWNSQFGGVSSSTVNSAIWDLYPVAAYDSYITIGQVDMSGEGPVTYVVIAPTTTAIDDSFGLGGTVEDYLAPNLYVTDGAWFNLTGDPDGEAGPDLKVLIAQVTTNGDIEVCMSFQIFEGGQSGNTTFYDQFCDAQLSPVSVSEFDGHGQVSIGPNPMTHQTVVNLNGQNVSLIEVRDLRGKIVQAIAVNSQTVVLDRQGMKSGFYLIQMIDDKGSILESQRLIVQ